jgi:hypothetical protein
MQMIEYTMAAKSLRMGLFVHHTDADREYAYDRKSHVGTLDMPSTGQMLKAGLLWI